MKKEILQLFLYNDKLKFNEIEKSLKSRSNKVAYHLKNLIKKNESVTNWEQRNEDLRLRLEGWT